MGARTLSEIADRLGVSDSTLRRWVRAGLVEVDEHGRPTETGVAQARVVGRLRARGYSLRRIIEAHERGSLASSALSSLAEDEPRVSVGRAAREAGLSRAFAQRLLTAVGPPSERGEVGASATEMLERAAVMIDAGIPESVILELAQVYGQAMRLVADAEVRLIHHQVHEPMMAAGLGGAAIAASLDQIVSTVLPQTSPVLDLIHRRYLRDFTEQDLIGHMEGPAGEQHRRSGDDLTRVRVAVAFADLAGFTRMTEELGDARAIDALERFMGAIVESLPDEARFVKTIGDEAMIVSADVPGLVRWATRFQGRVPGDLHARIGLHCGEALFYRGDYYGRVVNLASRLVARASEDEVVVTEAVADLRPDGVAFERLGEIRLRGFTQQTAILLATALGDDG